MSLIPLAVAVLAAPQASRGASVWYAFSSDAAPGESLGEDVWPAYALATRTGEGRHGAGLVLPGEGGNGLYLPNPVSFFGERAERGTIALWANPAHEEGDQGPTRVLFDLMRDTGNTLVDGYEIVMLTEKGKLKAKPSLLMQMEIDSPLAPGRWTHVALTWDCTQGTALYVDGDRRAERPGAFEPTELEGDWPGRIGCHTPWGGFPFAGSLDELRLFDRALTEVEVRQVRDLAPESPVVVVRPPGRTVVVRNGGEEARVWLQVWSPAKQLQPPFRGYLPFPFGAAPPEQLYWTAGTCSSEAVGGPVTVRRGEQRELPIPQDPGCPGPRVVRVLTGEGLSILAIAQQEATNSSAEVAGTRPLVFTAGEALEVTVVAAAGPGHAFRDTLRCELQDADGRPLCSAEAARDLKPEERRELKLRLRPETAPAPGRYELTVVAGGSALDQTPVYVTAPGDARSLCASGASYVSAVDDPAVLEAMVKDGVRFVRQHGKIGDYASATMDLEALLTHGLKASRMAAVPYSSACAQAERREWVKATGRNLGRYTRCNPAIVMQVIAGEGLGAPPCYCADCTGAFREYLRARYGTVPALNEAWGTHYADWRQVQPLGSPQDLDETAERLKTMRVALELPAENQARWRKLFELDRIRAIEWKRWHEAKLVQWYADFAEAFRSTNNGHTPIGEQPCWPNFESHVLFALGRIADIGGMDLYLPGEGPTTLGYAAELCLNFDLNASIFQSAGKPVMVHELYVQDNSPARLPEAQGWWLLGRGYNLLTYFTYDHYLEGVRNGLPLIFGLFDQEDKPYPAYESFRRFTADQRRFDEQWDYRSLRREAPEVAIFMGDDVSLANNLETGGATWEAAGVHGHNGAYWLTERAGYAVEFVNDDTLDRLAGKRALIVPWCHVLRRETAARILAFARGGGTVLMDGLVAQYDESYRSYADVPGAGLAEALGVRCPGYKDQPSRLIAADGAVLDTQGLQDVEIATAQVRLLDPDGHPGLVQSQVGKGQVLWLPSSLGRRNLGRAPDPKALALWRSLLEEAGALPRWTFTPRAGTANQAVFDVALRSKSDRERFAFLVSFFESSEGELALRLPGGKWTAMDALTHETVPLREEGGEWRMEVSLQDYGTRVVRLTG